MQSRPPLLIHPRYWLSWVSIALWRLCALLPAPLLTRVGNLFGTIVGMLAKRRKNIAKINLKLCFPDYSSDQIDLLLNAHLNSAGRGIMDIAAAWWWSDAKFFKHVTITGKEHLEQAFEQNSGVILFTGHFNSLDVSARILSSLRPTKLMYRPHENPVLERTIVGRRENYSDGVIARDNVRLMVRSLKKNLGVWFAPDQNYGHKNSVFAKFFGVPAATNTATSRLAQLSGAKVVPFVVYQQANGNYAMEIQPALDNFPSDSEQHDAERLNLILEKMIAKAPEQYHWMHRRFKDRPDDKPSYYQ